MCGITGFLNACYRPADSATLKCMMDAISHRGPDGEGQLIERSLGLGHRRLAIIDLSEAGIQPRTTPSGRWSIVYNGELYNYRDIRADLEAIGEQFDSHNDTEVLLRALEVWGTDALLKFDGMFAFAALDRSRNSLMIARDRFGVKPLYYGTAPDGTFAFASEIKALFANPSFSSRLNAEGMAEYLTFMNFISEQTLFKGIYLLPAGCVVEFPLDEPPQPGTRLVPHQFWDFRFTGEGDVQNIDQMADDIHDAFTAAVRRQLVSDVGVSSYLSGGVDSGSITAVAARERGRLRTFTCAFDTDRAKHDAKFDERDAAELMSRTFGTEHYEIILKHQDFEHCFTKLVHQLEEPRVGQSYPNYMVAGLASKFERVCLSGAGGDELFGGYPWRYFNGLPADGGDASSFDHYLGGYYKHWRRIAKTDNELKSLLVPIWDEAKGFDPYEAFKAIFPSEAFNSKSREEMLNWALYFEAKTFLNGLLIVEDKVSMAHSLETRVPFLDNALVELACATPISAKLDTGAVTGTGGRRKDGKRILRHMMSRLVPPEIYHRDKQGFSAPDATWFRDQSRGFIESRLTSDDAALFSLLNRNEVSRVLEAHLTGDRDARLNIWSFLSLDELARNYRL